MSRSSWRSPGFAAGSFSRVNVVLFKPFSVLVDSRKLSNVRACNDEITRLRKQQKFREVVELFNEMNGRGIKPDVVTCNQLITVYGKLGRPALALKMLETMEKRGLKPNKITYNSAISACEKGGKWEQALALLDQMREKGVTPDVITYNAAISACGKGGQWQQALVLLDQMRVMRSDLSVLPVDQVFVMAAYRSSNMKCYAVTHDRYMGHVETGSDSRAEFNGG